MFKNLLIKRNVATQLATLATKQNKDKVKEKVKYVTELSAIVGGVFGFAEGFDKYDGEPLFDKYFVGVPSFTVAGALLGGAFGAVTFFTWPISASYLLYKYTTTTTVEKKE